MRTYTSSMYYGYIRTDLFSTYEHIWSIKMHLNDFPYLFLFSFPPPSSVVYTIFWFFCLVCIKLLLFKSGFTFNCYFLWLHFAHIQHWYHHFNIDIVIHSFALFQKSICCCRNCCFFFCFIFIFSFPLYKKYHNSELFVHLDTLIWNSNQYKNNIKLSVERAHVNRKYYYNLAYEENASQMEYSTTKWKKRA